eukprot:s1698_g6.t1
MAALPQRPSTCSTWQAMQRRIARRAGQVSSFQEQPRLLAAAEDPEVWEEVLQSWPDVAQKLRPASRRAEAECSDVPSLEDLMPWIREALGANFVAENFHQLMPVAKVKQVPRDARPLGTKTPPRLQLTGPKSLRQNLDKLMASLQGGQDHRNVDFVGIDRLPRTLARQHYDLNKDPTVAADEFTLATRKAERRLHARKLTQSERAGEHRASTELQSPRRKHGNLREASEADEVRSHLLERLDYLHTCRGSMGESLYARDPARQRQRLEMQAHLRTAQKYSLQDVKRRPWGEKPREARCAYSAQVRWGRTILRPVLSSIVPVAEFGSRIWGVQGDDRQWIEAVGPACFFLVLRCHCDVFTVVAEPGMSGEAANGAAGVGDSSSTWRDKDPPPMFDGDIDQFKSFLRDLKIWRHETDVPVRKHGAKILRCLSGSAKAVCDEIDVDQLLTEQGADMIVTKLKEYFAPHLETSMPKAFEKAVYGEPRKSKDGFSEFILRQDAAYRELAEEGVKLTDDVKGYVMFRQANLSQMQEDQVTTWTQGSYDRSAVIKAFRKLDKVQKDKSGKHFATYEDGSEDEMQSDDGDSEEFVYLGESDLQQVYEESEIQEALATYQQVRRAIKDQKVGRGYYAPKGGVSVSQSTGSGGKGNSKSKISGSIKFSGKGGGTKVHIDLLKLRTKCARCGQLGHWARECVNEPDNRGKKSATEGGTAKSGFFEVSETDGQRFQVTLGQCMKPHEHQHVHPLPDPQRDPSAFEVGIVDTAAQGGLVGRERLRQLEEALQLQGLRIRWLDKKAQARGIGGEAAVCGVAEIPVGVAGVNGLIEVTVVEDRVPLLLSIKFLKEVEAIVDLVHQRLELRRFGKQCALTHLETGHIGVNVMHFAKGGWKYPGENSERSHDFRFWSTAVSSSLAFMSHIDLTKSKKVIFQHGSAQANGEDSAIRGSRSSKGSTSWSSQSRTRAPKLARSVRKDPRSDGVGTSASKAQLLARRWISVWISLMLATSSCTLALGACLPLRQSIEGVAHEGGNLCRAGGERSSTGIEEVQRAATSSLKELHTSCPSTCRSWEPSSTRDLVSGLPLPMDGGSHSDEPGAVQGASDPVQWQGVQHASHHGNAESSQQAEAQRQALPEEPRSQAEDPHREEAADPHTKKCQHDGGNPCEDSHEAARGRGTSLQMRKARNATDCQEGGSHSGKAVLEVHGESVQLLRMGCGGGQASAEEGTAGEGRRRDEESRTGSSGGASMDGAEDDGSSGGEACCLDAGGKDEAPRRSGAAEESALLADSGGGGGENGRSVSEPVTAAADHDEGDGDSPTDDGGGSASSQQQQRSRHEQQWHVRTELSDEEMTRWREENAPRACTLRSQRQWDLWAQRQIEDKDEALYERKVSQHFWLRSFTNGAWTLQHGILPSFDHTQQQEAIGIYEEEGFWQEAFYEEPVEKALSKSSRKSINKNMKQLVVAEVFSPPRVSQAAEEMGHVKGGAYDLATGYDLSKKQDRRRVKQELRQTDPDLLVICPPCGPFSILQNINIARFGKEVMQLKLAEGREHLAFGMELYEWQTRRGKMAIFEHPATSAGWDEEVVLRMLRRPEVLRVRADQCQYGLAVKGQPNKKPTDFMVNTPQLASKLSRRCHGGHQHQPLMGGIARLAQEYPKALCRAMIQGAEESHKAKTEKIWAAEEAPVNAEERDLEELLDEEVERQETLPPRIHSMNERTRDEKAHEDPLEEEEEDGSSQSLTRTDKQLIQKLHCNLGHPGNIEFAKALRLARARGAVWRYVKDEFRCPTCERNVRPKPARPAALPKNFEPGRALGIDVVFFPGLDVRKVPVLNMTDLATGYQMLEPLDSTLSNHVWEKFYGTWVRTFSMPEMILLDQGREFGKDFSAKVSEAGCLLKVIGARAPWQQGRTERHGGLAKEVFIKLREDLLPVTWAEWKLCVHAASRDTTQGDGSIHPPHKQHSHQQSSQSQESHQHHNINVGDVVYVFRVPLQRRRKAEEDLEDREGRRATWVGPGVVVMTEGANAWLSIRGELWKCAKEQLRKATEEEEVARDMLNEEFEELRMSMVRKASKRGFKDITNWPHPEDDEEEETEERPAQRPRLEEANQEGDQGSEGYTPGSLADTIEEPMEEPGERIAAESHRMCERLDGTLPRMPANSNFGPHRRERHQERWGPYRGGIAPQGAHDEEEDEEGRGDQDLWLYDEERQVIVRRHNQERANRFTPSLSRGCPVHPKFLTSERRTVKQYGNGQSTTTRENWRSEMGKPGSSQESGPQRWWVGYTEFKLRKIPPEVTLMVKRGSDEVKEEDIKPEEWEKWRVADAAEWAKVEATGAVRTMSVEESLDVEQQLREANLQQRILPSRIVRRWKPAEQPGVPPTMKSRWCVRGDKDPDLLDLIRHAPTVTTATLSVVLQLASSKLWQAAVGDLRNAFMQSDWLKRPAGRLFCRQPRGGLDGLDHRQLIEVLAGAYGLGDAPAHWRKSLKKALSALHLRQSSLDPCVFKWFEGEELGGLLVVEVDDLFAVGNFRFFQVMNELRQRFQFGKFVYLQEEEQGASFNGRRIQQKSDFSFEIDMEKFVTERMSEVVLEKGRASNPSEDATTQEKEAARAAIGSLTWAAKEGRPDAAAVASLCASSLSCLKIQDILDLNKCIRGVKATAGLKIKIQSIPVDQLCWGVVTDASYANAAKGKSQGAFAVIAYHRDMISKGSATCNLMHWRSGKIHRVVNSTLAAETQAFSRGLSELSWAVTVFNEFLAKDFDLKQWEAKAKEKRLCAMMREDSDERLRDGIGIVDAKSLFDHLSKETVGTTSDKRTALEMQVIRQTLNETGTSIRWVPHPCMIVDALTKWNGNVTPLIDMLDSGILSLTGSNNKSLPAVKSVSLASSDVHQGGKESCDSTEEPRGSRGVPVKRPRGPPLPLKLRRATTKEAALEQVAKVKKAFASPLLPSAFQQLHAETGVERQRKRQHLGNKAWFNLLIGVMLCVNTIVIGIETDYSRGRKLEEPGWSGHQDRLVFFIIETLFAVTFFSEVIVRMHHHGWEYAIDPWNIFDYCLVVFGWTDVLVSVTDTGSGGLRLASSLRLFRLLRVVRSIRGIKVLAGLWVVIQGLLDSYRTVLWVGGSQRDKPWVSQRSNPATEGGQDRFAFEYWYIGHKYVGSVLRAMLTMLQVATFDRWAENVARPLFHVAPMATPVLFLCIFVVSFGTLNILVAVMVERISVITADRRTHAEQARVRMEAYMLESMVEDLHANDKDGSGDLSQKEFKKIIRIPGLVKKLGLLGISIEEAESLFDIMDVNKSGTVTPEEFIAGLQKIKGQAKGRVWEWAHSWGKQVVRSAAYVQRIKFLNMQVDGVQERLNSSGDRRQGMGSEFAAWTALQFPTSGFFHHPPIWMVKTPWDFRIFRLASPGISLQYESFDRLKAAERNDSVTTSAAHRCLEQSDEFHGGGTTRAWDPELLQALRPQTAPELQGLPSRPFTPRSQMTKPPSPPKRETHDVEAVARTFNFARQCAAKKLPMPNLGTFTLGDESRLKLSNWSLGDDPLMALASSPLRDHVAVVEEGNFAGNRLTNKGVDAIVSSLGSDLTTLNLSANCFDGHGLESVLSFIRRAPKLTARQHQVFLDGMVAVAVGGGWAWRPRGAKEAQHFLPDVEVDALRTSDADATVKGGVSAPISSAIDAIQNGINDIKAQLEKSANFVTEAIKAAFFTGSKSLLPLESEDLKTEEETTQHDEHLRRYGGRLLGGSECDRTQKAASAQETLVRQATVLDGCLDGGQYLPVFYILKDELILSPVNISLTMGFTAMPFILKPGLAVASDRLPIFGRKRTPYLAGSMILVAGTYAGASLAQSYTSLLGFLSLNTFGRCLMSAVLQGMVVEVARQEGKEVSAVVGDFFGLKTFTALFSALFSSMVIGKLGSRSALRVCAVAPLLMLAGIGRCEREGGELAFVLSDEQMQAWAARSSMSVPAPLSETSSLSELLQCVRNPALWGPLLFLVGQITFGPSWGLRILVYRYALRSVPDRELVFGLTAVSLPLYLTPLLLTTGAYHSLPVSPQTLAVSGELVREVVLHMRLDDHFDLF